MVKETLSMDASDDYKFTYDSYHDEVIFAIYNTVSKTLDLQFYDGSTLQDAEDPRKPTLRLDGTSGDQQTGYIKGILPVDRTHFILHLY